MHVSPAQPGPHGCDGFLSALGQRVTSLLGEAFDVVPRIKQLFRGANSLAGCFCRTELAEVCGALQIRLLADSSHDLLRVMEINLNLLKIIESLTPAEQQSGSELKAYLEHEKTIPIAVEIDRPATSRELVLVLTDLAERTEAGACRPILHLEMHGYKKGVQTTSLEILSWDELGLLVRRINIAMKNSLIVTTAVCEGAYFAIAAALHPSWPAPFCGVIGPDKKVKSKFLLPAFSAFYAELLTKGNFSTALHELQQRNLPEYRALDMADLFRTGSEAYAQLTNGNILEERISNIVSQLSENDIKRRGGVEAVAAEIRATLTSYQSRLEERWRTFIMADIFPENAERFAPLNRAPNSP